MKRFASALSLYLVRIICSALPAMIISETSLQDMAFERVLLKNGTCETTKYRGNDTTLAIPEALYTAQADRIAAEAFLYNDSVISTGDMSFSKCANLWGTVFGEVLARIGGILFQMCSEPDHVELLGWQERIGLPRPLSYIDDSIFGCCARMKRICVFPGRCVNNTIFGIMRPLCTPIPR